MTNQEAESLAEKVKARYEKLPKDAGSGMESATWTLALTTLIAWAKELTADVGRSRSLIALASFLVGKDKKRQRLHRAALESPDLALKCKGCGADQDAYGSTCYEGVGGKVIEPDVCGYCGECETCKNLHWDACGACQACPDCGDDVWVRPDKGERLTSGGVWEKPGRRA
jgi:hypothetical protein